MIDTYIGVHQIDRLSKCFSLSLKTRARQAAVAFNGSRRQRAKLYLLGRLNKRVIHEESE